MGNSNGRSTGCKRQSFDGSFLGIGAPDRLLETPHTCSCDDDANAIAASSVFIRGSENICERTSTLWNGHHV
jgi:hypothetical protein